jgi:hypothetical protein
MEKLSEALAKAQLYTNNVNTTLNDESHVKVQQSSAKIIATSIEFADQFKDLKGTDKKTVALFVASELAKHFNVSLGETLSDSIDVLVDLSRGKYNIAKMKEVIDDVKPSCNQFSQCIIL